MVIVNAGATAAAAAARRRREQQEEEIMSSYNQRELAEDWEFKILRANTAIFRKPERLRAILEDEKRGGWVFVEKFDDKRIRLKRPASVNSVEQDFSSNYDPYRTQVGL